MFFNGVLVGGVITTFVLPHADDENGDHGGPLELAVYNSLLLLCPTIFLVAPTVEAFVFPGTVTTIFAAGTAVLFPSIAEIDTTSKKVPLDSSELISFIEKEADEQAPLYPGLSVIVTVNPFAEPYKNGLALSTKPPAAI